MRWKGRAQSRNVEDRRRSRTKVGGGIGIVGIIIVIVFSWITGQNPLSLLRQTGSLPGTETGGGRAISAKDEQLADFSKVVLKETENVWEKVFRDQLHKRYIPPTLVLYSGQTQAACGMANAATGPFYCPADQKVYLDTQFFYELSQRFGASGDFAMAYVIAHEVGHHVQYLLGITDQVHSQRRKLSQTAYNKLSVRLELQADFLAGVWAHYADNMEKILDQGDIEEALRAANAIGDDHLQKQAQGYVVPDAFTHGTSKQRMHWFMKGYQSGRLADGDTFNTPDL